MGSSSGHLRTRCLPGKSVGSGRNSLCSFDYITHLVRCKPGMGQKTGRHRKWYNKGQVTPSTQQLHVPWRLFHSILRLGWFKGDLGLVCCTLSQTREDLLCAGGQCMCWRDGSKGNRYHTASAGAVGLFT